MKDRELIEKFRKLWQVITRIKADVNTMPYAVNDSTGDQSITGTEVTVNLDEELYAHSNYSLASDVITVTEAGFYQIGYTVCWDTTNTAGGASHIVESHVDYYVSSYTAVDGSYKRGYAVEAPAGTRTGSVGATFLLSMEAGSKIRLRVDRVAGSTNIDTSADRVSLWMTKIS